MVGGVGGKALVAWAAYTLILIYALVLAPPSMTSTLERSTDFGDPGGRIRHLLSFFLEGYLSSSALGRVGLNFSLALGAATEGAQYFIPWRSCDPLDLLADFAGSILGFLFYFFRPSLRAGEVGGLSRLHTKVNGAGEEDS